jgi:hypothetical protein
MFVWLFSNYDQGNSQSYGDGLPNFDVVEDDDDSVLFQAVFKCNEYVDTLYVGVSLRSNSSFNLTVGPPGNLMK